MANQMAKLEALLKYIPFMEYYIESGFEKSEKFEMMKDLLISRRRQPLNILEKIESCINTRYKNLPKDVVVPEYIHQIFRIDLCSDDEDDNRDSYKRKDDDVLFVSIIHADPDTANTEKDSATSQYPKCLPNQIKKKELVDNVIINCDEVENDAVLKIEDIPRTPNKEKTSTIPTDCITLDSSSDEEETQPSRQNSEHSQSTNEMNLIVLPEQSGESVTEGNRRSPDIKHNVEALENMDLSEVEDIFLKCLKETSNMDADRFEKCLNNVIAESACENAMQENTVSDPQHSNLAFNTSHQQLNIPINVQQENAPNICMQYSIANHTPPSIVPPQVFHPETIYKKINFNDPRILKHLKVPNGYCPKPNVSASSASSRPISKPVPTTYGEHRRAKAAKEIEKQQLEERKRRLKEEAKRYEDELKRYKEEETKRRQEEESNRLQNKGTKLPQKGDRKVRQDQDAECQEGQVKQLKEKRKNEVKNNDTVQNILMSELKPYAAPLLDVLAQDKNKSSANESLQMKKVDRELKALECTVKGYNTFQDYIPSTDNGKRRSSVSARTAIAEQLRRKNTLPENEDEEEDFESQSSPKCNNTESSRTTKSPVSKRKYIDFVPDCYRPTPSGLPELNVKRILNQSVGKASEPEACKNTEFPESASNILRGKRRCSMSARFNIVKQLESDADESDFERKSKYSKISKQSEGGFSLQDHVQQSRIYERRRSTISIPQFQLVHSIPCSEESKQNKVDISQPSVLKPSKATTDLPDQLLEVEKENDQVYQLRKCTVKMRKLSTEEIERRSRQKTRSAIRIKASSDPKKKIIKKNTDRNMFEGNTKFCVLCKVKPADLTNHYIRSHKTESFVARLSPKALNELQDKVPFATEMPSTSRLKRFNVECAICKEELIDTFQNFYTHYSLHTGEYAYQCAGCQLLKPFRADIQSHQGHAKLCRNASIRLQYQYPKNSMTIHLYCCKICNFIQLNQENVFKHLREQHEKLQKDATCVDQLILCAIRDDMADDQDSAVSNSGLPEVDDIPVCNEPLVEDYCRDEVLSKIKTEIHLPNANVTDISVPMTTIHTSIQCKEEHFMHFENPDANDSGVADLNSFLLKPKKEQPTGKNTPYLVYKLYPKDMEYLGLFKCMAVDCFFSTNIDNEMLQHLEDHTSSACPPAEFLECAYCRLDGEDCLSPKALVAHISKQHGSSVYQCPVCCYRSCSPANVVVHVQGSHPQNKDHPTVFVCTECVEYPQDRLDQMKLAMQNNVQKLNCPYCPIGFYGLSFMMDHIQSVHSMANIENHLWSRYACIYCSEDHFKKEDIQIHLADKHPGELPYACERVLQPEKKFDNIENLILTDVSIEIAQDQMQSGHKILESNFGVDDIKPSAENLIQIMEDTVKALLKKLAGTTGVSPERLYRCPNAECGGLFSIFALWYRHMIKRHGCFMTKCPHCPPNGQAERELTSFENHFEEHRLYQFLCFCCGETFPTDQQIRQHAERAHSSSKDMRIESVAIAPGYSFSILVSVGTYTGRLEFLTTLKDVLHQRLQNAEELTAQKALSQWEVPFDSSWLEAFPAYTGRVQVNKKCMFPGCSHVQPELDLFQHCKAIHKIEGHKFSCSKCSYVVQECFDWNIIEEHTRMHHSNLYICCVCKFYHFDLRTFSQHINKEHNLRDVPILKLVRSDKGTNVGIAVVFAESKKSFSTTSSCFCCSAENMAVDTFLLHLKTIHNLKLNYFCNFCDKNIPLLNRSEKHFKEIHGLDNFKIRAEIKTSSKVLISTVMPLTFNVNSGIINNERQVAIKQELDDVYLLEEDDILIAEESNTCNAEAPASQTVGKIRVKQFNIPVSPTNAPSPFVSAASSSEIKPSPSMNTTCQSINTRCPAMNITTPAPPNLAMNASSASISSSQSIITINPILPEMIPSNLSMHSQYISMSSTSQSMNETSAGKNTTGSLYAPSLSVNTTRPAMKVSNLSVYAPIPTENKISQPVNLSQQAMNASNTIMQIQSSSKNIPNPAITAKIPAFNTSSSSIFAPRISISTESPTMNTVMSAMNTPISSMNITRPFICPSSSLPVNTRSPEINESASWRSTDISPNSIIMTDINLANLSYKTLPTTINAQTGIATMQTEFQAIKTNSVPYQPGLGASPGFTHLAQDGYRSYQ